MKAIERSYLCTDYHSFLPFNPPPPPSITILLSWHHQTDVLASCLPLCRLALIYLLPSNSTSAPEPAHTHTQQLCSSLPLKILHANQFNLPPPPSTHYPPLPNRPPTPPLNPRYHHCPQSDHRTYQYIPPAHIRPTNRSRKPTNSKHPGAGKRYYTRRCKGPVQH